MPSFPSAPAYTPPAPGQYAPPPAYSPPMPAQNAPTAARPMITWVFVALGVVIALVACIGLVVLGLVLAKVPPFA